MFGKHVIAAALVCFGGTLAAKAGEFGPVIERTVADDDPTGGGTFLIDLDTGTLSAPAKDAFEGGMKAAFTRMAEQGIDAIGKGVDDGVIGMDMISRRIGGPVANQFPEIPEPMAGRFLDELAEVGRPGTPIWIDAKAGVGPAATYLFQTREGSAGVLQIAGWDDGDKSVRIRYRIRTKSTPKGLKAPAAEMPEDAPAEAPAPIKGKLGPAAEEVLPFVDTAGARSPVFDVELRKLVRADPAKPERIWNSGQASILMAKSRQTGQMKVEHMGVVRVADDLWDKPAELQRQLRWLAPARPSPSVILPYSGEMPVVYLFKTRHGTLGVLQIVELAEPDGMRFRYRILED